MTTTLTRTELNKTAQKIGITITRSDLNKAIFIGNHYSYKYGEGHSFKSDLVDVFITQRGKSLSVDARINHTTGQQDINMRFSVRDNKLTLTNGTMNKNGIKQSLLDSKRLSDVLLCIYKHVRLASDRKWAIDFQMKTDAREAAAQQLDTGLLPKIIPNGSQLTYTAPAVGKDKICNGNCGKCRLNF